MAARVIKIVRPPSLLQTGNINPETAYDAGFTIPVLEAGVSPSVFGANLVQSVAANNARVTLQIPENFRTIKSFGAVGDGVIDDTTAINAAFAWGGRLDGENLTYAVSGNITLPSVVRLENANFKQLTPNNTNRRTLYQNGGSICQFKNVHVDRNGNGLGGSLSGAAGIYIDNCDYLYFDDVSATGDDYGNGIAIIKCDYAYLNRPHIYDIKGGSSSATAITDDMVQGLWLQRNKRLVVINPVVKNLTNEWLGQTEFNRFTRGISMGENQFVSIFAPEIDYIDQGVDITGGSQSEITVIGGNVSNAYSWGYKAANTQNNVKFIGSRAYRCGLSGFVAAAIDGAIPPLPTRNVTYIGCDALEIGYGGAWVGLGAIAGFRVMSNATNPTYPRNVSYHGCSAHANGAPMEYGFKSDAAYGGVGDTWCETHDCSVSGATIKDYDGLNYGYTEKSLSSAQNIAHSTYTDVVFNAVTNDYMGGNGGAAKEIKIGRAGLYCVTANCSWAGNANGTRLMRLMKNGVAVNGAKTRYVAADANSKFYDLTWQVKCAQGDLLTLNVMQDCGAALDLTAASMQAVLILKGV